MINVYFLRWLEGLQAARISFSVKRSNKITNFFFGETDRLPLRVTTADTENRTTL